MKKFFCLILTLICLFIGLWGCDSLTQPPVTLEDSLTIPQDGVIEASILERLKSENKAAVFKGQSGDIRYKWVLFGSEIKEVKALNLGIEVTEVTDEKIAFRFLSEEDFGFYPALSFYLNEIWEAQSAGLYLGSTSDSGKLQEVSITGSHFSVLNFAPQTQIGTFVILPYVEADKPESAVPPVTTSLSTVASNPVSTQSPVSAALPPVTASSVQTTVPHMQGHIPETIFPKTEPPVTQPSPITGTQPIATESIPETAPPEIDDSPQSYTCILSIECTAIFNNLSDLEQGKLSVLPKDGILFAPQEVTFYEGESVFDLLQRVCRENKIQLEASFTPLYNSAYVEGIGNLYEFDCGSGSGWMYRVDGWYPNYGCSRYALKAGERVEWRYTCDLGRDIGGGNFASE